MQTGIYAVSACAGEIVMTLVQVAKDDAAVVQLVAPRCPSEILVKPPPEQETFVAPKFASRQTCWPAAGAVKVPALISFVSVPCTPVCAVEPLMTSEVFAVSVVNVAAAGVVPPMGPGAGKVLPFRRAALRLGLTVLLVMTKGAVPPATVDVI